MADGPPVMVEPEPQTPSTAIMPLADMLAKLVQEVVAPGVVPAFQSMVTMASTWLAASMGTHSTAQLPVVSVALKVSPEFAAPVPPAWLSMTNASMRITPAVTVLVEASGYQVMLLFAT